jgi:hypothetical protein
MARKSYSAEQIIQLLREVEIHTSLGKTIAQEYLPAPSGGTLAAFDPALLVMPPAGLEIGYVPVVTHQEPSLEGSCMPPEQTATNQLTVNSFAGEYKRLPVENDWHSVTIFREQEQLWWQNAAGVRWKLSFSEGVLQTQEDCPYGNQSVGIKLVQDESGTYLSEISELIFLGEPYQRQ